jgi:mRNA-degrading endonuclease RelE of RelBE toxin-antitoxin system
MVFNPYIAISGLNLVLLAIAVLGVLGVAFRVPLIKWEFKIKQTRKRNKDLKALTKNQKKIVENVQKLENFIDWLNKQFPNVKTKKTFWLEFALDKNTRKQWFAKLFAENAKKVEDKIQQLKNPPRPPVRVPKKPLTAEQVKAIKDQHIKEVSASSENKEEKKA